MVNLSQSLPTCFFEKKKDKNSGGGHEDDYEGGDGDNGKDDVAAAGYSSANDAVHRNAGAKRERKRVPYIPRKASLANFLIRRRLHLYGGLENKIDEEDQNGGGDGDDGNNGGGRDDDKNGVGDGSGGNNKKESRDREGDGNGDKHGRSRRDWAENTKGKNMDFMDATGFGYRYGYHAGCENGYPVGQLKCAQEVE